MGSTETRDENAEDNQWSQNALNKLLLDSLPHAAMLIRKDRTILAANALAAEVGALPGGVCWHAFGQCQSLPDRDKVRLENDEPLLSDETHCTSWLADRTLSEQVPLNDPEVHAFDRIWDTYWVPLDEEVYLHYAIDVTEKVLQKKQLSESEARYKLLFESAGDAIIIHDENARILAVNAMTIERLGYTNSELMAMTVAQVDSPEEAGHAPARIATLMEQGHSLFETVHQRKDGSLIPIEVSARRIIWDGEPAMLSVCRDITERKRMAENLQQVVAAVESAGDAIGISDAQGCHIFQNQALSELFGYPTAEDLQAAGGGSAVVKDPAVAKEIFASIQSGKLWAGELEMVTKDGRVFPAFERANAIKDDVGNIIGLVGIITDITERKRMEDAVRDLARFPDENTNPVYRVSKDGVLLYSNHAARRLITEDLSEIGKKIPEQWIRMIKDAYDSGCAKTVELEVSGRTFRFDQIPVPEHGYVNVYATDVTKRKKAEADLLQYAHIVLSTPDMSALLDSDFVYLAANTAYVTAFGMSTDDVIGKTVAEVFGEEFFQSVIKPNAEICLAGKGVRYDEWFDFPVTGKHYMDVTYSPYHDSHNKIRGFSVIARDITELKEAEGELRQTAYEMEERIKELSCLHEFSRLVDSSVDTETILQGLVELLPSGWQFPEVTCGRVTIRGKEYRTDNFTTSEWMQTADVNVQGETVGAIDVGYLEEKPQSVEGPFLEEERDLINNLAERLGEVIARAHLEEERKELQQKLARAERMESIGILAGGVAHDLNNVLGPMVLLPDVISQDLANLEECNVEETQEALSVIKTHANRAAVIVRDLVSLGRRTNYNLTPLNINEHHCIAGGCADIESIKAANPGVSFAHKLAKESLIISADESHLSRAICNLLQNGAESIEKKGKVTLRTSKKSITEPLNGYEIVPEGDYAVIEISDTGKGIDEELFARMFEPFVTRKKNTDRSGSGLGLAVVNGIIKDHNGFIDVRSEVGKGCVFALYLPLIDRPKAEGAASEAESVCGGTERVLIVDDEPGQRFIGSMSLRRLGYEVAEVEDGHQALEHFEKAKEAGKEPPYDLIVLDMVMEEGFDGLKTYEAIQELFPKQRVIICSGHAEDNRAKAAQNLGADWLAKPYEKDDLARAVRKRLDRA